MDRSRDGKPCGMEAVACADSMALGSSVRNTEESDVNSRLLIGGAILVAGV